jgi:hypothetical protein
MQLKNSGDHTPESLYPQSPPEFWLVHKHNTLDILWLRTFYWRTSLLDMEISQTTTGSLDNADIV